MKILKHAAFLFVLLIVGCVTVSNMHKMNKFDPGANAYRDAIRWSDFEAADSYRKEGRTEASIQELKKLKGIKVTSYEVKQTLSAKDPLQVRQIVEIYYYKVDDMVERSLRDHQLWEYDTMVKNWVLKGDLPDFK